MNTFESELEKFILWFADQEEIPAESRANLLDHILKAGDIDEKAEKFIADTLTHLASVSQAKADELKTRLDVLHAAIERQKDPNFSLAENILADAEKKLDGLTTEFKSDFVAFEKGKSDAAESIEKSDEESEVEQLKSQL